MDATDKPQLPFKAEAIQHAEADTHSHAPSHRLSGVQLPSGLHSQPSLVFQAAASSQSTPKDKLTDISEGVLEVPIVTI